MCYGLRGQRFWAGKGLEAAAAVRPAPTSKVAVGWSLACSTCCRGDVCSGGKGFPGIGQDIPVHLSPVSRPFRTSVVLPRAGASKSTSPASTPTSCSPRMQRPRPQQQLLRGHQAAAAKGAARAGQGARRRRRGQAARRRRLSPRRPLRLRRWRGRPLRPQPLPTAKVVHGVVGPRKRGCQR